MIAHTDMQVVEVTMGSLPVTDRESFYRRVLAVSYLLLLMGLIKARWSCAFLLSL